MAVAAVLMIRSSVALILNDEREVFFIMTINYADKYSAKIDERFKTGALTAPAISNIVVKLNNATDKKLESYSTIQQTQDAISLAVKDIDLDGNTLVSKINLANGGILLDGKLIHITGQTLFDDNIVTNKMLQAGSVDASKIKVDSLSAICATIGTLRTATSGARTEIQDNLIEVYDSNNVLRVKMGVW